MTHRHMFKLWALVAVPWLLAVAAFSIHDHHRAIMRSVESSQSDRGTIATKSEIGGMVTALDWLRGASAYSGSTVASYGMLPTGITFFLFVVFLPWAARWSAAGNLDEEPDHG